VRGFPARKLKTMIENIRDTRAKHGSEGSGGAGTSVQRVTFEPVEAELGNSRFQVLGRPIPTTGVGTGVHTGQQVPVGWTGDEPKVIIAHSAQAIQPIRALPSGGSCAEELISSNGTIFFRNQFQLTDLKIQNVNKKPGILVGVQWPIGATDQFMTGFSSDFYAWQLNRPPFKIQGPRIAQATLFQEYHLPASYDNNGNPIGGNVPGFALSISLSIDPGYPPQALFQFPPVTFNLSFGSGSLSKLVIGNDGVHTFTYTISVNPPTVVMDDRKHLIAYYVVLIEGNPPTGTGKTDLMPVTQTMIFDLTSRTVVVPPPGGVIPSGGSPVVTTTLITPLKLIKGAIIDKRQLTITTQRSGSSPFGILQTASLDQILGPAQPITLSTSIPSTVNTPIQVSRFHVLWQQSVGLLNNYFLADLRTGAITPVGNGSTADSAVVNFEPGLVGEDFLFLFLEDDSGANNKHHTLRFQGFNLNDPGFPGTQIDRAMDQVVLMRPLSVDFAQTGFNAAFINGINPYITNSGNPNTNVIALLIVDDASALPGGRFVPLT